MLSTTLLALLLTHSAVGTPRDASPAVLWTVRVAHATFHLEFHPEDADTAQQVAEALRRAVPAAERWGTFRVPVSITIHPTHAALEAATRCVGYPWMRGWARYASIDIQSPRTWSRGTPSDEVMTQFLTHELTHCLTYQLSGDAAGWEARSIPRWFLEGIATITAGEEQRAAAPSPYERGGGPLRAPSALYRSEPDVAYATAHRAVLFLLDRFGADRVRRLMFAMGEGGDFTHAFRRALGVPLESFESDFERHVEMSRD